MSQKERQLDPSGCVDFTKHARQRLSECNLTEDEAITHLFASRQDRGSFLEHKKKKYSPEEQENVTYWVSDAGNFRFTVRERVNPDIDEVVYEVITVFNAQIQFGSFPGRRNTDKGRPWRIRQIAREREIKKSLLRQFS